MEDFVDRLAWETNASFDGAGGIPEEVPNPVIRTVSFSHVVEQKFIDFAKSVGIEAKNIPSHNGETNGLVELTIPMKVLRNGTVPAYSEAQEFQKVQNRLACQEEENQINDAYDRKHNLGSYSY